MSAEEVQADQTSEPLTGDEPPKPGSLVPVGADSELVPPSTGTEPSGATDPHSACDLLNQTCTMTQKQWIEEQRDDPVLGRLLQFYADGASQKPEKHRLTQEGPEVQQLCEQWSLLFLDHGILCRSYTDPNSGQKCIQRLVPEGRKMEIFQALHARPEAGHLGYDRIYPIIRHRFFWIGMAVDVRTWLRSCAVCQRTKGSRKGRYPLAQELAGAPLDRCAIDVSGPWPVTTNQNMWILVLQDYYSKWLEVWPLPNHQAETVAVKLVEFMARYGCIRKLHSDRGGEFESYLIAAICKIWDIDKTRTTSYYPQSDGMVERANRTIKQILKGYVLEREDTWDRYLWAVTMAYNATEHASTGCTPFRLMHSMCRDPELPTDLLYGMSQVRLGASCTVEYCEKQKARAQQIFANVREKLERSAVFQKHYHARMGLHLEEYRVGDEVWWFYPPTANKKLGLRWLGPFTVVQVNQPGHTVKISGLNRLQWVHASGLKRVCRTPDGKLLNDHPFSGRKSGAQGTRIVAAA